MGDDRFEGLTEEQRHCLRLVARGFSSKEIANPLGLHHRAIDQRLDRARRHLGEPDRMTAARRFAEFEATAPTYDRDIRVTPLVVPLPPLPETSEATWGEREPPEPDVVREAAMPPSFEMNYEHQRRGPRNEFTPLQRLIMIVAIIVGLVLAIVAAPALRDSFQRVANSIEPPT